MCASASIRRAARYRREPHNAIALGCAVRPDNPRLSTIASVSIGSWVSRLLRGPIPWAHFVPAPIVAGWSTTNTSVPVSAEGSGVVRCLAPDDDLLVNHVDPLGGSRSGKELLGLADLVDRKRER